nr:penicillin-binding protein 2 [Gemmiger qucibialis]
MPKQPDNKNQSTRHHNRRSPEPGQNHALTLNGRIMVLLLVIGFIAAGCGVLIYKLYTLQIRDAEQYRVQAAEQQLSDTQIPATRGSIYSANGKLLAKSSVVWNIIANPSKCNQDYVAEASQKISELLNGSVSAEKIQEQLSKTNSQYRVIAKGIDMVTAQSIIDYANTKRITNGKAEGDPDAKYETVLSMYKESSSTREYPNGMYLSSVLGFCDDSGNGMYGLEKSYDEKLVGTPGRSISSENAWGYELANEESDTHAAINGYNLNLTIDDTIQTVLETELSNAIDDYDVQNRASAIVMNVNTGAVLGMATTPQFDPNDPYNITEPKLQAILDNAGTALTEDDISVLQSRLGQDAVADIIADGVVNPNGTKSIDEEGNEIDVPSEKSQLQGMIREAEWKNKAVTELYYPGSVFKLMTAAAALDSGLMGANQQFYCGGDLTVFPNTEWEHSYRCAEGNAHGWLDMAGALNHSCNLYFIQVAEKMSAEFFYNYYQAFGLTQTTGIDLPYEAKGISKTQQEMEQVETDLYSTAFGQSQKLTLIQMAAAVASTVNGGYLMTPYVWII